MIAMRACKIDGGSSHTAPPYSYPYDAGRKPYYGERAFSVAAAGVWNSLRYESVTSSSSLLVFQKRL